MLAFPQFAAIFRHPGGVEMRGQRGSERGLAARLAAQHADARDKAGIHRRRQPGAVRMRIATHGRAGDRHLQSRLVDADMRHLRPGIKFAQHLGKAGTIVFAAEYRIDGQLQHRPAQPAHEVPMRVAVIQVIVRQRAGCNAARGAQGRQPRIVQHHDGRLREQGMQPLFPARRLDAGKLRFGIADDQQFFATFLRAIEQQLMAAVQRAELAHHQRPLEFFHASASCKSDVY